jgi:hypothetical protein
MIDEHERDDVQPDQDSLSMHFTGRNDTYLRPLDTAVILRTMLWQEFELSRMTAGWMGAMGDYESKAQMGRFAYVHSQNMSYLNDRIKELPGGSTFRTGTPRALREGFELISMASDKIAFLTAYQFLLKRLYADYEELMARLDPILNAPTLDRIKKVLLERETISSWLREQLRFGYDGDEAAEAALETWKSYVAKVWALALRSGKEPERGIAWPASPVQEPAGPVPSETVNDPRFIPFVEKPGLRIHEDPDNSPVFGSIKHMLYVNAVEINAATTLSYLYYSFHGMPLEFYCDIARHMWDETRHSLMGVRRLQQLGYKLEQFRFRPPLKLKSKTSMQEFLNGYMALTNIGEACSFPFKRKAAESFWKFDDALSAIQSEFDVADERMHVDFGTKWGPEMHKHIHNEVITAKMLNQKVRERHVNRMALAPEDERAQSLIHNVSEFCGSLALDLKFDNY